VCELLCVCSFFMSNRAYYFQCRHWNIIQGYEEFWVDFHIVEKDRITCVN
jgi:hypothetical protein